MDDPEELCRGLHRPVLASSRRRHHPGLAHGGQADAVILLSEARMRRIELLETLGNKREPPPRGKHRNTPL